MKKGEKIALLVGGVALVAGVAYLASQPKVRPNVVYVPTGGGSSSVAQTVAAATAVAPAAENLIDSIFGGSNSGNTTDQNNGAMPSTYDDMNASLGNVNMMSGI